MHNLISIAMCSYNGERFIKEQIDSIIAQTYKNFELIIVDDGSKDNTINIIKEYQLKDHRIKLFQNDNNLGFVKNFEKAISLCSGDFIALADQDDVWKKNKLEVFLKNINGNMLIYSDAILIDQHSKETGKQYETAEAYGLDLKQVAGKVPYFEILSKEGEVATFEEFVKEFESKQKEIISEFIKQVKESK